MRHIISVLVENKFGVLTHIAGLFSARGFNISSLAVGETEDPTISRMTIVVQGDERILEQITKQLHKLIDVIKIIDLTKKKHIDRELLLFKVDAGDNKEKIIEILKKHDAEFLEQEGSRIMVEVLNSKEKIDALLKDLPHSYIKEMVRTGVIAIEK